MFEFDKIQSSQYPEINLCVVRGHFVTPHSHINYYIDMTAMRSKQNVAAKVANAIAEQYVTTTCIDTILCMDRLSCGVSDGEGHHVHQHGQDHQYLHAGVQQ